MTPEERAPLIQQYADGHEEVVNALKNFPPDKLGDHPITLQIAKEHLRFACDDCS